MACTAMTNSTTSPSRREFTDRNYTMEPPTRKKNMFGPYQLLRTVGEGEFGKVKLGVHLKTGVEVAIKLIRKQDVDTASRYTKVEREIFVLRSVRHPNIVKLFDVLETEKYIGIVLEYASGGELFEYILAHRYLKERDACRLFAQLISGVNYLHQKHIVHRDLKLENLLLDRNRSIIITDFGFANNFNKPEEDLMATSCGSPCYAAPELVVSDGFYVGPAADIWSCGVILYAMLCGFLPYDDDERNPNGDSIGLLYDYILNTELLFPDYVSADARDLLRKMLEVDPQKRCDMRTIIEHRWMEPYKDLLQKSLEQLEAEASTELWSAAASGDTSLSKEFGTPLADTPPSAPARTDGIFTKSHKRHTIHIDYDLDLVGIGSGTSPNNEMVDMEGLAGMETAKKASIEEVQERVLRTDKTSIRDSDSPSTFESDRCHEFSSPASVGSRHDSPSQHSSHYSPGKDRSPALKPDSASPLGEDEWDSERHSSPNKRHGSRDMHGASTSAVPTLLVDRSHHEEGVQPQTSISNARVATGGPSRAVSDSRRHSTSRKAGRFGTSSLLSSFARRSNSTGKSHLQAEDNRADIPLHPQSPTSIGAVPPPPPSARVAVRRGIRSPDARRKVVSLFIGETPSKGHGREPSADETLWPIPQSPRSVADSVGSSGERSKASRLMGWFRRYSIMQRDAPPEIPTSHPQQLQPCTPEKSTDAEPSSGSPRRNANSPIKSPIAVARAIIRRQSPSMSPKTRDEAKLRVHDGAVDQTALTSREPSEVMMEVRQVLAQMGIEIQADRGYKLKCLRPEKSQAGKTSAENTATTIQERHSPEEKVERRRKFSMSKGPLLGFFRRGTEKAAMHTAPPSESATLAPISSSTTHTSMAETRAGIYGDPYIDSGSAIYFTVELCRIKNLTGLYIVDIRRRKGNLWSFRFLYYILLEKLDLSGKGGYH
ncbi:uncharacterized protein VTP21DRAFT_1984 [Calcarisporiella thermophila]|uniref:uncharacterized protein n=1 Tax=Calcarisporiella thermophila TaxID=911321 RepID=UPI00374242C1